MQSTRNSDLTPAWHGWIVTMRDITTVAIVVDHHAAARIDVLACRAHVWAMDTPSNRRAAEAIWKRRAQSNAIRRVTVFDFDPSEPDRVVSHQLDAIDMHHDRFTQTPEWARAEVFGATLTPELRAHLLSFGFDTFEETPGGFVATRSEARADRG